ncbi:hypothetical protein A3A46_02395 [Candidatus Roizmanbacteria bacterium RIFCSPLOWO2_01_FULL_37_13]|uniref:Uncharacterized protein n=1 Tax=Candidatus Roizmanbacteria bacterium RIFCSPHIGHO2_02_FULL_38_11 TaxID=1802039 RepID=A0A1F7H0K9_9BACT|nr:MAG: hypothetical protein A3C25_03010 [Candidatus Roizmanbacteria bacterium RIFCSPHIGHO2_02_FULL_38_11]OGK34164.1 MAG: hypothetical protein A3F58_03670 [Candidatus Roizmanbacteria bacterium RIFCSPHIGHO2_12_FULL_37_9b]OGK41427.1 MAG: hypothetical protein A3A46_02395 [Candidatus Roizmanbacteria bacterium RIFCSPLOWO2_01_FULL_37_13]
MVFEECSFSVLGIIKEGEAVSGISVAGIRATADCGVQKIAGMQYGSLVCWVELLNRGGTIFALDSIKCSGQCLLGLALEFTP